MMRGCLSACFVILGMMAGCGALRDRLYDSVYIAAAEMVDNLLDIDPEILTAEHPIQLDGLDANGRTALLMCGFDPQGVTLEKLDKDCLHIARALKASGSNMRHTDPLGWNAVSMSAVRGLTRFCSFLVDEGVPIDTPVIGAEGRSALLLSLSNGKFDTALMLLEKGANASFVDAAGTGLEHYAVRRVSLEPQELPQLRAFVKALKGRFRVNMVDSRGRTPLMYATMNKEAGTMEFLLKGLGADPTILDAFGVSAQAMAPDVDLAALLRDATVDWAIKEHGTQSRSGGKKHTKRRESLGGKVGGGGSSNTDEDL